MSYSVIDGLVCSNLDERSQTLQKGTKLGVLEQLDEGRSCHSPSESLEPMTDFVQKEENLPDEVSSQVREVPCEEGHCRIGLKRRQEKDPVFGRYCPPSSQPRRSPFTGRVVEGEQCDEEVVNEVVYRRPTESKLGEEDYLQLLVPKSDVEAVLRLCHAGKEVDGSMMAEVCKLFDVTKLRTSPDKPSTNQVERFHKTKYAILAKTVSEGQRDWDDQLLFVLAAYRATKHNSTGFTPNRLVLGKEVLGPLM